MKTSTFDMNFVLPPVVLMTEVVKDIPVYNSDAGGSQATQCC